MMMATRSSAARPSASSPAASSVTRSPLRPQLQDSQPPRESGDRKASRAGSFSTRLKNSRPSDGEISGNGSGPVVLRPALGTDWSTTWSDTDPSGHENFCSGLAGSVRRETREGPLNSHSVAS